MGQPPAPAQPAASAQPQPAGPVHRAQGADAVKLHQYALDAEKNLEQLATGLATAGADPGSVKTVTQMADVARKIVKAMAGGIHAQAQPPQQAQPQPTTMSAAHDHLNQQLAANRQQAQPGGQ